MKILALDSSAVVASVALCEDDKLLAEYTLNNGNTHSETLLPMVESIFRHFGISARDIDLFAVSAGPGSFTGIRIGAATLKGLAFGKGTPCVAVSTLEALAENIAPLDGILVPCMDARRGQAYNALFESKNGVTVRITPDRAISLSELADELRAYNGKKIYLSGDGYAVAREALTKYGIECEITPELLINENAASVARVGQRMLLRGETVTDKELSPSYLRLPQAERERLERERSQEQKNG